MEYIFIEVECENKKTTIAELKGHREIIQEQAKQGYRYAGFLPVTMGRVVKFLK
ncbi:MAG: hypothetical protein RR728_03300 [Oscillospiraceae bacterium]